MRTSLVVALAQSFLVWSISLLLQTTHHFIMLQTILGTLFPSEGGKIVVVVVDAASTQTATMTGSDAGAGAVTGGTVDDECTATHGPTLSSNEKKATTTTTTTTTVVVEGIELPTHRILNGIHLHRNGHGVRSINFFGMNVKVYVAHLYSPSPLHSEEQVLSMWSRNQNPPKKDEEHQLTHHQQNHLATSASSTMTDHYHHHFVDLHQHHHKSSPPPPPPHYKDRSPLLLQLDFTFLRHVGQGRVESAWSQQLEHSVSYRYHGYEQDRDAFIQAASRQAIVHGGTQSVLLVDDETRIIDQGQHTHTIHGHDFQQSFLSMWFGPQAVAEDLKSGLLRGSSSSSSSA